MGAHPRLPPAVEEQVQRHAGQGRVAAAQADQAGVSCQLLRAMIFLMIHRATLLHCPCCTPDFHPQERHDVKGCFFLSFSCTDEQLKEEEERIEEGEADTRKKLKAMRDHNKEWEGTRENRVSRLSCIEILEILGVTVSASRPLCCCRCPSSKEEGILRYPHLSHVGWHMEGLCDQEARKEKGVYLYSLYAIISMQWSIAS